MKKILFSALALCSFMTMKAQSPLQAGDVAPNFTYSDINNVSHNLYNYTDSGYTVILDVSATWCGPCWAVHNSHVFDSLTHHYGLNGTISPKKIKFFFFEGDASTTNADLMGTGTNTQGNWVAGTNYTILDQAGIKTQYPIDGYPHFYVICPNRTVAFSKAGYTTAMLQENFWTPYIQSCPSKITGTNASTISVGTPTNICAGSPTLLSAKIQNMGTTPLTSATVVAKVAGANVASFNWSGNLGTYDFASVNIGNYTFNSGTTPVTYEVTTAGDLLATDNSKILSSSAITANFKTWTLNVKTDDYPGEITWKLKNSTGGIVQQQTYTAGPGTGGQGGVDAKKLFTYPFSLNASECYTLEVTDVYGDGLYGVAAAADTGYVKLFDGANTTPLINFGGGYGSGATSIAKTGVVTSINEFDNANVDVYPNPTSSDLNVRGVTGNATFNFVDVLGRTIKTISLENINSEIKLNVSELTKGNYILKITNEGKSIVKSIVITE